MFCCCQKKFASISKACRNVHSVNTLPHYTKVSMTSHRIWLDYSQEQGCKVSLAIYNYEKNLPYRQLKHISPWLPLRSRTAPRGPYQKNLIPLPRDSSSESHTFRQISSSDQGPQFLQELLMSCGFTSPACPRHHPLNVFWRVSSAFQGRLAGHSTDVATMLLAHGPKPESSSL